MLTTIYSFCSLTDCADGAGPEAGLIQATDGSFYGTTTFGGSFGCDQEGCGTVFRISPNGALKTLLTFQNDGAWPFAGLVQGSDGKFYGTTFFGGFNGGFGTVFKMSPNGMMLANPYSFGGYDGENPSASLAKGTDGKFYGTTSEGGANSSGTVFRISPGGVLSTLYNFCSQGGSSCTDGATPYAGLVQGTDGKFYGTTSSDGANGNFGTVFSISVGGAPSAGK
jgi:uncharacterized repeat protein (TIGR03803 family)